MMMLPLALLLGALPMSGDTVRVETRHFASAAGDRGYRLVQPSRPRAGMPLLVVLHGCLQSPEDFARGSQFDLKAARDRGWIVVYPQQEASNHPNRCWNWYDPAHQHRGAGEPAILTGIIHEVLQATRADARRVYLVGVSAGGAMAVNLLALYPELFAGVAVHSALPAFAAGNVAEALVAMKAPEPFDTARAAGRVLSAMEPAGRVVPLMVLQGAADLSVGAANATHLAAQFGAAYGQLSGDVLVATRAMEILGGREVSTTSYRHSRGTTDVIIISLVTGLGHAWSGGDKSGTFTDSAGPDATGRFLEFLARHALAERIP